MFLVPYGKKNRSLVDEPQDFFNMDNFFNNLFEDQFMPAIFSADAHFKVDIKDDGKEYLVEAELPGVRKEEIRIDYYNNNLIISVVRNEEINVEKENYIRKERRSGSYSRSFYVENVIEDKISAKFENGVLSMVLPKREARVTGKKRIVIE